MMNPSREVTPNCRKDIYQTKISTSPQFQQHAKRGKKNGSDCADAGYTSLFFTKSA
jgi:hypothetical protein